jgi:hypothetical protein
MFHSVITLVLLVFCIVGARAQGPGKNEPGWSIMVISIADACGAPRQKVEQAAEFVAQWGTRNLPDPSRLTKETVMEEVGNNGDAREIVKQKGAFIYPCSRWREILDMFLSSKGLVMGGVAPPAEQSAPAEARWRNRDGECQFRFEPSEGPIETINLQLEKDGSPELQLSVWIKSKGLADLGKRQSDGCRFYDNIKGYVGAGDAKYMATYGASTACDSSGSKIGTESQNFDVFNIKDAARIVTIIRAILAKETLPFVLTSGPKARQSIQIPLQGLKQAIREISVCPAYVRNAVAD